MNKNQLLKTLTASLVLSTLLLQPLQAQQTYPNKPIRVINPLAAGGALDALLRRIGQAYSERTGQNFVVDSKPGANTIIAAETCAKAPPDGYTLCLLSNSTISLNPSLYSKLPYEVPKSFEPITQVAFATQVLVMHPSIPASNINELVAYSKANPNKINFASFGIGGDGHLTMEWLKKKTGADMTHVPYKGAAPAQTAFSAGEVHLMLLIVGNPNLVSQINSGQRKALLVTGSNRSSLIPNVPSFAEAGYSLDSQTWFGIFAPAGTPKDIVNKLNADLVAVLRSPEFQNKWLIPNGFEAVGSSPEDFAKFITSDSKRGADLVKISGATLD